MMKIAILAGTALTLAACTTTGNIERRGAQGAAAGAIAGAVIGNNVGDGDAGRGAAIGAVIGGVAGAAKGRNEDVVSGEGTQRRQNARGQELIWDNRAQRYFYYGANGRTYWQNGELRG